MRTRTAGEAIRWAWSGGDLDALGARLEGHTGSPFKDTTGTPANKAVADPGDAPITLSVAKGATLVPPYLQAYVAAAPHSTVTNFLSKRINDLCPA